MKKGAQKRRGSAQFRLVQIRVVRVANPCLSVSVRGLKIIHPNREFPNQKIQANTGKYRLFSAQKFPFFYPAGTWRKQGNPAQNTPKNALTIC